MATVAVVTAINNRHGHDDEEAARRERKRQKKLKKLEEEGDLDDYLREKEARKREKEEQRRAEKAARKEKKKKKVEQEEEEDEEQDGGHNGGAEEEEEEEMQLPEAAARRLEEVSVGDFPFGRKVQANEFAEITESDVQQFFSALDPDLGAKGKAKLNWILPALMGPYFLDPPLEDTEWCLDLMDGTDEPEVTVQKLLEVLQNDDTQRLFKMRQSCFRREEEERAAQLETEVTREDMVRHIGNIVVRDDALMTLPFTLLYIVIFISLVNEHLGIYSRQLMEKSLENWLNGRDPLTSADKNVDNLDSFWEWTIGVAIPGVLGFPGNSTDDQFTQYWLASRHTLVGDVRLKYEKFDGSSEEVWVLHTTKAKEYLATKPTAFKTAAQLGALDLKENQGWDSRDIEKMWYSFITYDEFSESMAITSAYVRIDPFGTAVPVMNSGAVFLNPYGSPPLGIIPDILFLIIVGKMFFSEFKEVIASLRLGCDEFADYWKIWNIVDWCSILFSLMCVALWITCLAGPTDAQLQALLTDGKFNQDVMLLNVTTLDYVYDKVNIIRGYYFALHMVMAINTCAIVMKFFKAFQSNPRLKVVTRTFIRAGRDLAHFFIIFLTLFLPFTIIGHILFGNDIPEMGSVMASVNTGVALLMGDFGWYVDVSPEHVASRLPSGMPTVVLFIWFFLFNFVMVLVVLNMLLAVILEHYIEVTKEVEKDAPTIWQQIRDFLKEARATRGFVPLATLDLLLGDDDDKAHWDDRLGERQPVDKDSLLKAFEKQKMTEKQALHLMKLLQARTWKEKVLAEADAGDKDEQQKTAEEILETVKDNAEQLGAIKETLQQEGTWLGLDEKLERLLQSMKDLKQEHSILKSKVDDTISRKR